MGYFSGLANISQNVNAIANFGCNCSDFANFTAGRIALILRGECTFLLKVQNAIAAKASAALIYNDGATNERMGPFLGGFGDDNNAIPTFSLSYNLGSLFAEILQVDNLTVQVYANAIQYTTITSNVCAETKDSKSQNTIVIGSHLDSVDAGPGINDNGSGSSANLELAIQFAKYYKNQKNKIRFCWWGAEEMGLLGSVYYVGNLTADQKKLIIANLNLDMIASPNSFNGVYNGTMAASNIRNGSEYIMRLILKYVTMDPTYNYDLTPFNGRSDYFPFINNGIPAGGLFTGAEQIKDMTGRSRYGGLANTPYDPCYHMDCDNYENINSVTFTSMAKTAAYVVQSLANWDGVSMSV